MLAMLFALSLAATGPRPLPLAAMKPVPVGGTGLTLKQATAGVGLVYTKPDATRRLIALEAPTPNGLDGALSLQLRCGLVQDADQTARLAVLLFERGGGVWARVAGDPLEAGEPRDVALSLVGLSQAAFSRDDDGALDLAAVERIWLGIVVDGAGGGALTIGKVAASPEPYRPSRPLAVAGSWSVGQDPAVQSKLTTTTDDGHEVMRCDLTVPGGRHMYILPQCRMATADAFGYTHLRLTYRASFPAGGLRMLISVIETGGGQYVVEPPPPASEEWATIEVPLDRLVLGGWSQDANGMLDLGSLAAVMVGAHGTSEGNGGSGFIEAKEIAFVVAEH